MRNVYVQTNGDLHVCTCARAHPDSKTRTAGGRLVSRDNGIILQGCGWIWLLLQLLLLLLPLILVGIDCCCSPVGGATVDCLQYGLPGERVGDLLRSLHVLDEDELQQLLRLVQLVRRRTATVNQ